MISLGIDTSNYTTSAAICSGGVPVQRGKLLPVKKGELGLRQSDAVFHHVQQLPEVLARLREQTDAAPEVIGVSVRPRPIDGSYMPCFEVGKSAALALGAVMGVPVRAVSHQEGHIAAALYSAGCLDSIDERFAAFHVSGGTTEAVLVHNEPQGFSTEYICGSLDLKAGQAIDRVAGMLGLGFPGGQELEKLALECDAPQKFKIAMKGMDCCLSGIENICRRMIDSGSSKQETARMCLDGIRLSLAAMTESILLKFGDIPIIYAGGVMSNSIIRDDFTKRYGGLFAAPEYSRDNAAGVALLAARGKGTVI